MKESYLYNSCKIDAISSEFLHYVMETVLQFQLVQKSWCKTSCKKSWTSCIALHYSKYLASMHDDNPNPTKIDIHLHAKNDHQTEVIKIILLLRALVQIVVMILIKINSVDCIKSTDHECTTVRLGSCMFYSH